MEKEQEKTSKLTRHSSHQKILSKPLIALIVIVGILMVFNQVQLNTISGMVGATTLKTAVSRTPLFSSGGGDDLSDINLAEITSTAQTLAAVYDLEGLDGDQVMEVMFPTGTPEYGEELGVSFDDPISSLDVLAKMYNPLKAELENSNPEAFQRFINLASNPYGISCEYCCGVGPIGVDKNGRSRCGCSHNPGVLSVALYLAAYTDYNDGEILREVMRWKTLFFPKNMIELGASIAGGDSSVLQDLPGMVGGC